MTDLMERTLSSPAGPQTRQQRVNLHLYTAALTNDSRFLKQAQSVLRASLADEVVLVGQSDKPEAADETIGRDIRLVRFRNRAAFLPKFKLFGCLKYGEFTYREVQLARRLRPAILQCHSVWSLPAAVLARAATGAPMVYDARELETECNGLRGINKMFRRKLERALIRYCDSVLCVSDSIADWYAREYDMARPFVVRNVPDARTQTANGNSASLRERFEIPRDALIFFYSGALTFGRSIEQMTRVFQRVRSDRHLVFMGFGPLEAFVRKASAASPNIHFLPAVPPDQVLGCVASADIGVAAHLEPTCLNHRYALPNKFFEYLLAGLPVWVNDVHEEMAALVRRYGFGWVTPHGEAEMANWVNALTPDELRAKRDSAATAHQYFSWENEERTLVAAYRQAMQHRAAGRRAGSSDEQRNLLTHPR